MIFFLIRLIIWLAGLAVVGYFILGYFGYQPNWRYYEESRASCQEQLRDCQKNLLKGGLDGAKETCSFQCVDPKLLIHKEEK